VVPEDLFAVQEVSSQPSCTAEACKETNFKASVEHPKLNIILSSIMEDLASA